MRYDSKSINVTSSYPFGLLLKMPEAKPRRICIGDVHGHYQGLMTLLEAITPTAEDQIYFLGDLIDRGPASAQVVEFVRQSPYTSLLGNHELLMLEAFPNNEVFNPGLQAWLYSGGRETVVSYGDQGISVDHLNWMRSLPTHLDLGDIWLVHAGVHPTLPIEAQTEQEFCWIRGEFHGLDQPYFRDKLIITGHTITFTLPGVAPGQIAQGNGWLDIDTGAYHPKSGWMTGLDLTNRMVYQVNVFMDTVRTLPFEAAVDRVELGRIKTHC